MYKLRRIELINCTKSYLISKHGGEEGEHNHMLSWKLQAQ